MTTDRFVTGLGLAVVAAVTLTACGPNDKPKPTVPASSNTAPAALLSEGTAPSTNQRIFLVKGVVTEVMPETKKIKIAHQEIPDYMEAMTMVFDVKGGQDLTKFKAGDAVHFRMIVTADDGWIDNLTKMDESTEPPPPKPESFRQVRDVDPLEIGALVPEYHFTNHLGQAVKLSELKGKAVAVTFVFTRCLFPTFCPRMSANFAAAQQKLETISGGPTNWHLLSITFDPEHDTPAVLKNYAAQYKCDPTHWSFVTGELIDITAIAEQFGMMFWRSDPSRPANIDHNLRTVVIDANGRVQKIFIENEWKVDELVNEIVRAAIVPRETAKSAPAAATSP